MELIYYGILFLIGYLTGSIPFGYIAGKLNRLNIQKVGSGNIGATNVTRILGISWGVPVGLLDFAKSYVFIVLVNRLLSISEGSFVGMLALAPILGHMFPVWLRFKGGKGVSVALASLTAILGPIFLIIMLLCWLIVAKITHIMSLSNLILFGLLPAALALNGQNTDIVLLSSVIGILIFWAHRENIQRLALGNESRLPY